MLVASPRHTAADIEDWSRAERLDAVNAERWSARLQRLASAATAEIREFAAHGDCYVSCSWGKDSLAVAHLVASGGLELPLVWVRVAGVENPDCPLVRDQFLAMFPRVPYHEVCVDHDSAARRTSAPGFALAAQRFGDRYVSGVRGAESHTRALRVASHGLSTARACAPIGRWSTAEVFAYLYTHALPVHPAYAQTMGGAREREWLRVGALGGERGRGHGRREWERTYYPRELSVALSIIGKK